LSTNYWLLTTGNYIPIYFKPFYYHFILYYDSVAETYTIEGAILVLYSVAKKQIMKAGVSNEIEDLKNEVDSTTYENLLQAYTQLEKSQKELERVNQHLAEKILAFQVKKVRYSNLHENEPSAELVASEVFNRRILASLISRVTDDGKGFDTTRENNTHELISMRERMLSINGGLSVSSEPGKGTTICAVIPKIKPIQ
jgi:hypothetical protein